MAAQAGKDFLLKIGDGEASETFATVGGVRSGSLSINGTLADITDQSSTGRWREMLAATGVRTATASGAGVFKDDAPIAAVEAAARGQTIDNWQIVVPDFGTYEGPFHVATFTLTGEQEDAVGFDIALESAGELTFTAAGA